VRAQGGERGGAEPEPEHGGGDRDHPGAGGCRRERDAEQREAEHEEEDAEQSPLGGAAHAARLEADGVAFRFLMDVDLRRATPLDQPTIEQIGRLAADWRGSGFEGILPPDIGRYVVGFGRAGDAGVIAELNGEPIGAAWYRLFPAAEPGYGFVADDVPELSVGVDARYRRAGVGRRLLVALLERARADGVSRLSLSVEFDNPAVRLYERVGFETVGVNGGAWTMAATTKRMPGASGARLQSPSRPDPGA
jgi:ribosomal protein S18 acetylase RimI-like enzyme